MSIFAFTVFFYLHQM